MSSFLIKQFIKGIALRGEAADISENVEGSLFHNSTDSKLKSYIEAAVREVVTDSQIQTLTNKTISAADNLIVVASTNPNLSNTELNAALSELQTDIDSKGAALSSHIADADPHPQYETSVEAQAKVDAHANRTDNPHAVTKTQVGLSNVDNTSDASKPISIATQYALNLKANSTDVYTKIESDANFEPKNSNIQTHISSTSNPHSVTKVQVGLGNVDNTSDLNKPISTATQNALDLKIDESREGQVNGIATLDGTGKVPASQLPSYVDDILEYPNLVALPVSGENGKLYVTLDDNKVYRWSGSVYIEVSSSAATTWGGIVGTLSNQTDLQNALNAKANTSHTHTSTDITDFSEAVDDRVNSLIVSGSGVSAVYDDVANTLTISSTVSVVTDHTALSNIGTNTHTQIDSHIASTSNPHNVTKSQVGLSNVDNTSDANKPISSATQLALDAKYDTSNPSGYVNTAQASAAAPVQSVAGKTGSVLLTKSDVGLSNVDNTSDINKPVSTATQNALDLKVNSSIVGQPNGIASLDGFGKVPSSQLPSYVDDIVEASNFLSLPVSGEESKIYVTLDTNKCYRWSGSAYIEVSPSEVNSVAGKTGVVTLNKSDVGLSNVDNTSDLNKPISTATQNALDLKANSTHTHIAADITDLSEAIDDRISTTIVAGTNVTVAYNDSLNTLTISAAGGGSGGATTLDELTDVSVPSPSNGQALVYNSTSSLWEAQTIGSGGGGGATDLNGLNDVTLSGTLDNQILRYDLASTQWKNETLLKDDIGLSNVDNTSDANKPISTATQNALNTKANSSDVYTKTESDANFEPKNANIQSHISSTSNPHSVTKTQVGLGNVDNTSDLSKPISTLTQTALDGKADTAHTHVSTDITDFSEAVDDRVSSLLVAGSNITLTYNDVANTLVIDSAGAPASTSAERLITNVYNGSGATIPKMSVVYVNGAQGDQARIVLSQANAEATSSKTYGVVVADIANTASGTVVEQGRLDNLNTDIAEWTEGDVLWLSPTIAGGITNVKPSAPNHAVFVGYLVRKHQSVGAIQVSIQNGYELHELHNVAISSIVDNQVLKYDAPNSLWRNETLVKADVGLSDVDNTSDADKPISTLTQTALDGKANTSHTHVAADITDFNSAVDARIPSIPSTIISSVNGDTGPDVVLDSDDIAEGTSNLYFTDERVDDRVSNLLVAGDGISVNYNDVANTLTIASTVDQIPILSKGSLLTSDGTQNGELTVGTNGQILSADSSEPSGLKWIAAPSGGGGGGSTKYVRGFSISGFITSSAEAAMPIIITSDATINSIKAYCKTTGAGVNIDILKNGTSIFTGGYTLSINSSSVITVSSSNYSSTLLADDILELTVNSAEAGISKDLVVSIELT